MLTILPLRVLTGRCRCELVCCSCGVCCCEFTFTLLVPPDISGGLGCCGGSSLVSPIPCISDIRSSGRFMGSLTDLSILPGFSMSKRLNSYNLFWL